MPGLVVEACRWACGLTQYCGKWQGLVKKFDFFLGEMQVLRRKPAVIRCMFSRDHAEAVRRMDWSLEAETAVRGLWQLSPCGICPGLSDPTL